jgi:hypothetical protein
VALVETLTESRFRDGFSNRSDFTYAALGHLFKYYEELAEESVQDIEFDPIAICCEWVEYDDIDSALADFSDTYETEEDLQDNLGFIPVEGSPRILIGQ